MDGGEDVFGDAAAVGTFGGGEADAAMIQVGRVDVVEAGGGGADEADGRAIEQCGIDTGDGADDEGVGVMEQFSGEGAAGEGLDIAEGGEEMGQGDGFVDEDAHG